MLIFELFFFIGFALFSLGCIAFGFFWIEHFDGSNDYSLPKVNYFNPFELAALRNGYKGIIEVVLVNLWQRQLLEVIGKGKAARINQLTLSNPNFDNPIEKVVYHFARFDRQPKEFFNDTHLHSQLKSHIKPINQRLEKWHLKRTPIQIKQAWQKIGAILFIIGSFGLTKLYLGLQNPIFFLTLLFTHLILTVWFLKPHPNTILGRRYQEQLAQHFEWLKLTDDDKNPAFVVALFGATALAGFEDFMPFEESGVGGAGGCGSSDGGCGGGGCGGGCG